MWEVAAIARPFFPWPGNKVKLVPFIAPMIPPHVETFLEVFGGSAALSLALKPKKGRLDIYNDVDNDLFNVFCCIKENQHALARELRFLPVHGREPFQLYRNIAAHEADYFKHIEEEKLVLQDRACFTQEQAEELLKVLNDRAKLFDVVRAAAFLLRQYGSYSGTGNSVAVKTLRVEPIIKRFPEVSRRLRPGKNGRVPTVVDADIQGGIVVWPHWHPHRHHLGRQRPRPQLRLLRHDCRRVLAAPQLVSC